MNITLETIDELRERTNVTYSEAKKALENCNGELVEAIIYLEEKGVSSSNSSSSKKKNFNKKTKSFFSTITNINFDLLKNGKIILRLPLLIFIIMSIIGFPFVIVGLIISIFIGYKIEFTKNGESLKEFNDTINKMSESINSHVNKNE
jgi:hypothetical protein